MKVIVTESQLRNIVKRQRNKRKKDVEEAASLTSPSTTNLSTPSSSSSSTSSPSGGDGSVINIPERPEGVPEMGIWKSNMVRGVANPAGESVKKHEDYPNANPVQGQGNKLR
jgi:hypothetical protein